MAYIYKPVCDYIFFCIVVMGCKLRWLNLFYSDYFGLCQILVSFGIILLAYLFFLIIRAIEKVTTYNQNLKAVTKNKN